MPTITVVNDDTVFLELMRTLLEGEGYETMILREGGTAYQELKRLRPDLVVLDIRMDHPETGWQILELLRLDPATTSMPVIICTADTQAIRLKADYLREKHCDVLEKPFELDDLLAKVAAFVGPPPGPRHT